MGPGEVEIISQRVSIHATTFQRVGEGMECNPVISCNHIYHTIIEVVLSCSFYFGLFSLEVKGHKLSQPWRNVRKHVFGFLWLQCIF